MDLRKQQIHELGIMTSVDSAAKCIRFLKEKYDQILYQLLLSRTNDKRQCSVHLVVVIPDLFSDA